MPDIKTKIFSKAIVIRALFYFSKTINRTKVMEVILSLEAEDTLLTIMGDRQMKTQLKIFQFKGGNLCLWIKMTISILKLLLQ